MSKGSVNQRILENALTTIFNGSGISNAREKASIKYPLTNKYLEVDVWYPDLHLCFEFQDDYHYQPTWYHQHSLDVVQEKDNTKRNLLLQQGETLILIPCWWDGSIARLQQTIKFHRPDLFPGQPTEHIISLNPSSSFFPELGVRLMLASFPSSPGLIDVTENNTWWLGEKYDGIRCSWNPLEEQLCSRHGVLIDVNSSVRSSFGQVVMDGEIWCGRGSFSESKYLIHASIEKPNWAIFRLVCFDSASPSIAWQPFESRYSLILGTFGFDHPSVIIAPRLMCSDSLTLTKCLQHIVEWEGEGVILRKPLSYYQPGRSQNLVKLKQDYQGDQEGLVVEVLANGDVLLQLEDRSLVEVPKSSCFLYRQLVSGDVVSFKHGPIYGNALEAPKMEGECEHEASNMIVYRIRDDLSWEDITGKSHEYFLNERFRGLDIFPKRAESNSSENRGSMRARLEHLAREKGLDPLLAAHWYNAPPQEFTQHSVVRQFIQKFHANNWPLALQNLFPDLHLEITHFKHLKVPVQHRRLFFDYFAKQHGFDPLVPTSWYTVSTSVLETHEEFKTIIKYYNVLSNCLIHLYPHIGLEKSKFTISVKDRKEFFDRYARMQGFSPLIPDNWYSVSVQALAKHHEYNEIMKYYDTLSECLRSLYPGIGFQKIGFSVEANAPAAKRSDRLFFDNFAASHNFDPLVSNEWYNVSHCHMLSKLPELNVILQTYDNKLSACLMHLYPDIGLEKSKLSAAMMGVQHRLYFDNFAAAKGFNPLIPSNWYKMSRAQGHAPVLKFYRGKLSDCLLQLYPNIGLERLKFYFN